MLDLTTDATTASAIEANDARIAFLQQQLAVAAAVAAHSNPPAEFPFDAGLPAAFEMGGFTNTLPFREAAEGWLMQIEAEDCFDFVVPASELKMRIADGAILGAGGPLAYTPHGFGQAVNLLLTTRPANLAGCLRWLRPARRAPAFNEDVLPRRSRADEDLMMFRTFNAPRPGAVRPGTAPAYVRAIRAVVSTRHSAQYLDDTALCAALTAELEPEAPAQVFRGTDVTHGYAEVGTTGRHLVRTLHWTNSETGSKSLSFAAGARIRIVDALVRFGGRSVVEAVITEDASMTRMRHTAPGGKSDEAKKARISGERMQSKIRTVLEKGEAVGGMWEAALVGFPKAMTTEERETFQTMDLGIAWEILADRLEETGAFAGDDRAAWLAMMTDETRLGGSVDLPRGSAAHVCASFAVMGRRATTMEDSTRWQELAGRWLLNGWRA